MGAFRFGERVLGLCAGTRAPVIADTGAHPALHRSWIEAQHRASGREPRACCHRFVE